MTYTVVTVCFNSQNSILLTLNSVAEQSFENYEHLIIDGCSTDKTVEIVKEYNNPRIRLISEPDEGIYDAMNKAVELAEGEWLIFINAADTFFSNTVLADVEPYLAGRKICYSHSLHANNTKTPDPQVLDIEFLKNSMVCHQAVFYHRDCFQEVGKYDIQYKMVADYDHMIRCVLRYADDDVIGHIPHTISIFDSTGLTSEHRIRRMFESIKVKLKFHFFRAAFGMLIHMVKSAKRSL